MVKIIYFILIKILSNLSIKILFKKEYNSVYYRLRYNLQKKTISEIIDIIFYRRI